MGDADVDFSAAHLTLVERLNCPAALFFTAHDNETEATGAAGVSIKHNLGIQDSAVVLKQLFQAGVGLSPGDVPNKEFGCHLTPACSRLDCTRVGRQNRVL